MMAASSPRPGSGMRLSDADRDQALALLGEHYAVGRLDKEEYDERSDAIWSARTRADLRPVFADLPRPVEQRPEHVPGRRPHGPRFPLAPVIVLLVLLTVVTHLPWILLGLAAWCLLGSRGSQMRGRRRGWS